MYRLLFQGRGSEVVMNESDFDALDEDESNPYATMRGGDGL